MDVILHRNQDKDMSTGKENKNEFVKTFVLSDESLNSYGFWVKTDGIDLKQFKKNPVMLWDHNRPWRGTKDEVLPIGTWENIRVEDGKLLADASFDMGDEFAAEIARKVKDGVIKMCSIGFEVKEDTEDVKLLKPGQTRRTVTKSKLVESSITPFGANENSVSLYRGGKLIELSEGADNIGVELLNSNKKIEMKNIALKLGLSEGATEAEIVAKIEELKISSQTASQEVEALKKEQETVRLSRIEKAVDDAVKAGKLSAAGKEHYIMLGKSMGVDFLGKTLDGLSSQPRMSTMIGGGGTTGATGKKFKEYSQNELENLKAQDLDTYKRLYKEEYGIDLK